MTIALAILFGIGRWAPVVLILLSLLLTTFVHGFGSDQFLILLMLTFIAIQVLLIMERRRWRKRTRATMSDVREAFQGDRLQPGFTNLPDGNMVHQESYQRGAGAMGQMWRSAIEGLVEPTLIDDLATVIWNSTAEQKLFAAQFRNLPAEQQAPTHLRARAAATFLRARLLNAEKAIPPQ